MPRTVRFTLGVVGVTTSGLWVRWIRNTMRKVTIVVPVLIT
jgi:hypothetical protein